MPVPTLPYDCIVNILENLEYDRSTLYRCLFVNRFWCTYAVRLLWHRPFSSSHRDKHYMIVKTYLLFFNESEQKSLIPFNITLDYQTQNSSPLFPYAKYLEEFSDLDFGLSIEVFLNYSDGQNNCNDRRVDAILISLWRMLMRQCVKIKSMKIRPSLFLYGFDGPDIEGVMHTRSAFDHLREFDFYVDEYYDGTFSRTIDLIQKLPSLCSGIKKMSICLEEDPIYNIEFEEEAHWIAKIIYAQHNISDFRLSASKNMRTVKIISSALVKNVNRLTSLSFVGISFDGISLKLLSNLQCLERLALSICSGLTQTHIQSFPQTLKLQELRLDRNEWANEVDVGLIQKCRSLSKIVINNLTTEKIAAARNSPNITDITVEMKSASFLDEFFDWIRQYKMLVKLHVKNNYFEGCGLFIRSLGEILPTSLTYLGLVCEVIEPEELSEFFKKCNAPLETLIIALDPLGYEHLSVIEESVTTSRSLKLLSLSNRSDSEIWGPRELGVIERIKQQGIEMFDYVSYNCYLAGCFL
ncbi:7539_t:CDS:1 [Acaulospora morrowiae]|uniref:7539_t:CDS:1 n=1 Tax=Acaulospora morrowiae TaxID=94023 RepID=A0A9N9GM69_9GLOM|nr:7539_t:CDS:1 [Acaulospora morrowiae]